MQKAAVVAVMAVGFAVFVVIAFAADPERNADEAGQRACRTFYDALSAIDQGQDDVARVRFQDALVAAQHSERPPGLESRLDVLNNISVMVQQEIEEPDPEAIWLDGLPPSGERFLEQITVVDQTCRKAGVGPAA